VKERWVHVVFVASAACVNKPSSNAAPSSGLDGGAVGRTEPGGASVARVAEFDAGDCKAPSAKAKCASGFCEIPAGCFVMGSPETEWEHAPQERRTSVTLTRAFRIGQHEVTQREWLAAAFPNPSRTEPDDGGTRGDCTSDASCPVGNVTWYEAATYANRLSAKNGLPPCYRLNGCVGEVGKDPVGLQCRSFEVTSPTIYECAGYRLPTDAEWEYAARAGTTAAYYGGDITTRATVGVCAREPALDGIAWYCSNAGPFTHPVGKLAPNAWGLFDMLGNASEWTNDESGRIPPTTTLTDPDWSQGPGEGRDVRGGAYFGWPSLCRAASRIGLPANARAPSGGFRVARTVL
jgi:formylglycine-generating enzyme required for sulfatase activity